MNALLPANSKTESTVLSRCRLSALWAALIFLYLYADHLSLYRPGQMDKITNGQIGPFTVSQGKLLIFSTLMLIPTLMIYLSLALKPALTRELNLSLGVVYTLVNLGNLVGESWAYYILLGIAAIGLTLLIVLTAWRWYSARD